MPEELNRVSCSSTFLEIAREIRKGATRHNAKAVIASLKERIAAYSDRCSMRDAAYLETMLALRLGDMSALDCCEALEALMYDTLASDRVRILAMHGVSAIRARSEAWKENEGRRAKALALANDAGLNVEAFVTLVNWAVALLEKRQVDGARRKMAEAWRRYSAATRSEQRYEEMQDARALLLLQSGILSLQDARDRGRPVKSQKQDITRGVQSFTAAISHYAANDHLRTNKLIDFARHLIEVASFGHAEVWARARTVMDSAVKSTEAHSCYRCRGYYEYVASLYVFLRGRLWSCVDRERAASMYVESEQYAARGISEFRARADPWVNVVEEQAAISAMCTERCMRPKKVFLSHSGADKALVRSFGDALKVLGYEPWLDEDAMSAGVELERALRRGFAESCAAVFFVTPSFVDKQFIATEINYALAERRKKTERFALITLVLADENGRRGVVPEMLRSYVWKSPQNQVEALCELVRALPLRPGAPVWPDELPDPRDDL